MVFDPGQQLAPLDGEYSETVVPMSAGHQEFVVGGEDEEVMGDREVLGERTSHSLPPAPAESQQHNAYSTATLIIHCLHNFIHRTYVHIHTYVEVYTVSEAGKVFVL